MKKKNKVIAIVLVCIMLYDLILLYASWLDLRCFLDRGPVTFDTIRQFFSYPFHPGPMIELIIAAVLAVSLIVVFLKGRDKKTSREISETQNTENARDGNTRSTDGTGC